MVRKHVASLIEAYKAAADAYDALGLDDEGSEAAYIDMERARESAAFAIADFTDGIISFRKAMRLLRERLDALRVIFGEGE